ncbi:MAG: NUDIX hydrolase [Calditrichaeota bacterium]|nr:MAG: NUDIX hydrolase [Calditrichota bacterium]
MKVIINEKKVIYQGFLTLEKCRLQHELFNGEMSEVIVRENCFRGDSVAALVYDLPNDKIILIRQFRYPVYASEPQNDWLWEIPAGSCLPPETPVASIIKELKEEINLQVDENSLEFIGGYFVSPGGTSERVFLYGVPFNSTTFRITNGGLREEGEDIEVRQFSFAALWAKKENSITQDLKTALALQWLKIKKMETETAR